MSFLDFTSVASNVFGTTAGLYTLGKIAHTVYIFVAKDGVAIPSYMVGMQDKLKTARDIMDKLSDEQRRLINDLSSGSTKTLDELEREWEECWDQFNSVLKDRSECGLIGKYWINSEVRELDRMVTVVFSDTLTASSHAKRERQKSRRAQERQILRDTVVREATNAAAAAGQQFEMLPPLAPQIPLVIPGSHMRAVFSQMESDLDQSPV